MVSDRCAGLVSLLTLCMHEVEMLWRLTGVLGWLPCSLCVYMRSRCYGVRQVCWAGSLAHAVYA